MVADGERIEDFYESYDANENDQLELPEFQKLIRDMKKATP
jgi:hypothetical protein